MRVAVCYNRVPPRPGKGESQDRISEEGAQTEALAVASALRRLGHDAVMSPLGDDVRGFAGELLSIRPDVVFNLCEGYWGDSGMELHAAALIELLGLPHTGSAALCLGLTQDKALTKDLLAANGLPTPPYITVAVGHDIPAGHALAYPLIVKPRREDASLGITGDSIVADAGQLARRVGYVHRTYRQDALVEEFIDGRELNAAVFGNDPRLALPISEIVFRPGLAHPIVSYDGKWLPESPEFRRTEPVCPAVLESDVERTVRDAAVRACALLGCRDYARVDIRLRDGLPQILEINANPDISPDAGLARSAAAAGMDYPQLVGRVLDMARGRKEAVDA